MGVPALDCTGIVSDLTRTVSDREGLAIREMLAPVSMRNLPTPVFSSLEIILMVGCGPRYPLLTFTASP
jgi:hypothetical protein